MNVAGRDILNRGRGGLNFISKYISGFIDPPYPSGRNENDAMFIWNAELLPDGRPLPA